MLVQIVGPGCPRCRATEETVRKSCKQCNIEADITHIYDPKEYAQLGVRLTPAVLIDGKVVFSGRVPTEEEAEVFLKEHFSQEGRCPPSK